MCVLLSVTCACVCMRVCMCMRVCACVHVHACVCVIVYMYVPACTIYIVCMIYVYAILYSTVYIAVINCFVCMYIYICSMQYVEQYQCSIYMHSAHSIQYSTLYRACQYPGVYFPEYCRYSLHAHRALYIRYLQGKHLFACRISLQ